MEKLHSIINVLIIIFAITIALYGGLLIAKGCACSSTAGGLAIDFSLINSFFGLCCLIIGIWILIKKFKKHKDILHIGIFIYGILLMIASIFVNFSTGREIAKRYEGTEMIVLSPEGFSVLVALISIIGLLVYPFIKENRNIFK